MSKYNHLQDSSVKYAMTERKTTRGTYGNFESTFEKDYELERQYLEKLRTQRMKAEKLFQEYTNVTKECKREKESNGRLREEIEELRKERTVEGQKKEREISAIRMEIEQYKSEIKALVVDKSTLIKKFKEYENQLEYMSSLRDQNQEIRTRITELQQQLNDFQKHHEKATKANEQLIEELRQKNLSLQKEKMLTNKQSKRQRQERLKLQQEKTRLQQMIAQKTLAFQKLVANYQEELRIKEKTYEKMVTELQESNKYWSNKYQQKSKEAQTYKKIQQQHKESLRKGKEELESLRFRLTQKQKKYDILQKDLSECYNSLREKQEEFKEIQTHYQTSITIREKQSGRLKLLQEENSQLKIWIEEYQALMQSKRRRELQHKQLVQDELEELRKIQHIFKDFE